MTPKEKLLRAAMLIEEVLASLKVNAKPCTCCERVTILNWPVKAAKDALGLIPERLRRAANSEAFAP